MCYSLPLLKCSHFVTSKVLFFEIAIESFFVIYLHIYILEEFIFFDFLNVFHTHYNDAFARYLEINLIKIDKQKRAALHN